MRRTITAPFLLLILLCCCGGALAAPEASVDRAVVNEGDPVTLTIRREGGSGGDQPDYTPLAQDFHVYGSSESSRHVITNGRAESWTEWQTTLVPKRSGALSIPPIQVGGERTAAIAIRVQPASDTQDGSNEPLFLEALIDSESVYVQQQVLLTVRIYHAIRLDDMNLSEPELDNAQVEKIGQESFRRDIDGITYQVHELVYAIFPQQPGELHIPELVFSARQPLRSRSFFDFPGQGRGLRRLTPQFTVQVKPIPPAFSGSPWLPARDLSLLDSWSGDPERLTEGESVTRTITLQAEGLAAVQLPELKVPDVDGARLYADQPQLENLGDARGLHGKRVQGMALIPARPGQIELPPIRVRWWDVDSDSEKVAELPARRLTVHAAGGTPATPDPTALPSPADGLTVAAPATAADQRLVYWQLTTALLALAWLATLLFWRRRPAAAAPQTVKPEAVESSEKSCFAALEARCRAGDAAGARQALLQWGAARYEPPPQTLEQLAAHSDSTALVEAIQQLERVLFGNDAGSWQGEPLLGAVRDLRGRKREGSVAKDGLRTLYPSS